MCRHAFPALILDAPTTMVGGFMTMSLVDTAFTFSGTVSVRATTVGVHGVEEIWNIMGRCNVDVAQGGIPTEVLKMEKRVEMVGAEVITGP